MDPNFDALTSELNLLRSLGYKFQQQGLIAVQAAESGLNNLANYHKAFSVASGISGAYPAVQQKANEFGISGALATSSLHAANEGLSSAQANIHSFNISALVGVTFTDFAGQNLIQAVIAAAPPDKQDVVAELASSQLDRPFTDEQLDTILGKFRGDLPGRRRGAWDALYSPGEDKLAQAAHSMREIIREIVADLGSNKRVEACDWYKPSEEKQNPTFSERLRLLLYGSENKPEAETNFLNAQIKEFSDLVNSVIKVAHGSPRLDKDQVARGMRKIEELVYLILSRWQSA